MTLQANQAHWSPPRLDSVRWQRVPDSAAAVESVLRGESDIATSVPPSLAAAVNGSPGVVVHARSSGNITYLGFNTASEPLRERAVRACLAHAIDRRRIVDAVLAGHGTLTQTLVHPRSEWHCPETEDYGYDPRAAAEALEQAGWRRTASGARADPHGRVLSLSLLTVRGDDMKQDAARLVARQLAEVGVTVRLESAAMAELLNDRVYPRCYEMVLLALNPGPSPSFLRAFYHSGGGADPGNRFGYANPAVDDLIDALPPLDESRAARAMVQDIQRLVARDVPHVPLFYADVVDVAASRLILPRLDALFGNRFYDLYQWDVMDPNPTSGQG